jgi:hypothetical protein
VTPVGDRDLVERHVDRVIVRRTALEVHLLPSRPEEPPGAALTLPWETPRLVAVKGMRSGCAPIAARIWEIQRCLHVRQPIKGYGSLLETLPA